MTELQARPESAPREQASGRRRSQLRLRLAAALVASVAAVACGAASVNGGSVLPGEVTRRDTRILHQECAVDSADAEKIDIGGDPRPDIIIVQVRGHEVCRYVDLNHDGIVDSWVYRDASGNVTRRESDFDRDGRIDQIAIYRAGVLVEAEWATTLDGRLDTWNFYDHGRLVRSERDSDGDGQIDQWWEYPNPEHPECPVIHSDVDRDGHPDPGATVDVCAEPRSYTPPERGGERAPEGPSFAPSNPNAIPTEVEEHAAPPQAGKK